MVALSLSTLGMWLEDPGALSSGNSRILMFFVGLVAFCMLVQAIVVVVFALGAMKMNKRLIVMAEELHRRSIPIINSAESLFAETAPKFRTISDNLVETSHLVRTKAQEFNTTLTDVNEKTKAQVTRVDNLLTTTLTRTAAIADTIHNSIRKPVNEMAGVVNGFKAGLDVLFTQARQVGNYRGPKPR
jgi:methyl-accepting chemotaxis protein